MIGGQKRKILLLLSACVDMEENMGNQRECGVLLPISALPSEYGIGCFSKSAYEFVDQLKACLLYTSELSIWKEEKYQKLQGTYPVIFLSFADVKQTNYKDAICKIKRIIATVYQQYIKIAESDLSLIHI